MFTNIHLWMGKTEAESYVSTVIFSPTCPKRTRDLLSSEDSDTQSPPTKMPNTEVKHADQTHDHEHGSVKVMLTNFMADYCQGIRLIIYSILELYSTRYCPDAHL